MSGSVGYALVGTHDVAADVRRIAAELTDEAVDTLRGARGAALDEAVHDARKACKRVRALVRLVRDAFDDSASVNAAYRDAARIVSEVRDATAVIETFDAMVEACGVHQDWVEGARTALARRRDEVLADVDVHARVQEVVDALRAARAGVDDWRLHDDGFAAVAGGIRRTYGRAVTRHEQAVGDPSPEALHAWRKRVKDHRYHMELLTPAWPQGLGPRAAALDALEDLLGDDHDLAVLRAIVHREHERLEPSAARSLLDVLDHHRSDLQTAAWSAGARLLAERPDALVERMAAYWEAWDADLRRAAVPAPALVGV